MTSQSSASSLAKHRQSWLDLVSQASPPAGETAVVCSAQVHSQQQLPREEAEERGEEEVDGGPQVIESSVHGGPSIVASNEENTAAEGEAQQESSGAQDEGETWCFYTFKIWPDIPFVKLLCNIFIGFSENYVWILIKNLWHRPQFHVDPPPPKKLCSLVVQCVAEKRNVAFATSLLGPYL